MYRTHHCGELSLDHLNQTVTLSGWVQKSRNKGFIIWADLRDRYGITQLVFDEERTPKTVSEQAQNLGREFVIQIEGTVIERESKNPQMSTGAIEVLVEKLSLLNVYKFYVVKMILNLSLNLSKKNLILLLYINILISLFQMI